MEVIYKKVCGVDVHKTFIVAVICDSSSVKPQYLRKRFSTFNNSLIEFRNWLLANDCHNVCMESTGKYYVPVYNALEGYISNVVVANPKWVKCVKNEKDDNKDAKWIADLFKLGIVRQSFIPAKDIRVLRELTRYLYKLTNMRTSEKNRFTNALTVGNCKLDMVFSDIFGKSSSAIINTIISQDTFNNEDILKNVHGHCKASSEDILNAITEDILNAISGISWVDAQKQRMLAIQEHINYLNKEIESIRKIIDVLVKPYESYINFLCTIPGVDRKSAITIIAEIGTDMSQFSSHYRLAAWAGCAVADKECTYYANKYNILAKRRGKKRAIIAIARKILVAIYHMLSTGETFNPSDLAKVETSDTEKIKYTKNNFLQSTKQLFSLGLSQDEIILLINSQNSTLTPIT